MGKKSIKGHLESVSVSSSHFSIYNAESITLRIMDGTVHEDGKLIGQKQFKLIEIKLYSQEGIAELASHMATHFGFKAVGNNDKENRELTHKIENKWRGKKIEIMLHD